MEHFFDREALLLRRNQMTKIVAGGWSGRRSFELISVEQSIKLPLFRFEEFLPYESTLLPSGDLVHVRDDDHARYPGQCVSVAISERKCFEISCNQWEYTCNGDELAASMIIAFIPKRSWFQYRFLSSANGELQIDHGACVWFDTSVPIGLAVGLQILLETRRGS